MRRILLAIVIAVVLVSSAFGANVTLPTFQILTRGILDDGRFELATQADVAIEFGGGYKFGQCLDQ